jgi:hypothetical protein
MAKISTYPIISIPTLNDLLIGTDVDNLNETKNFTIGDIANLIIVGNYVPYIGATTDVDLGIHSITASSFIVPGGLSTEFVKADGSLDSTVYQPAGNYITGLSGEATASGPGVSAVVLDNGAVIGKVLTGLTITGGSISSSDSILQAFGKLQNQVNGLYGGAIYQGTWNALTNTPTLTSSVGVQGYYYIVSVAGNTVLDGISDWNVGDWAIFDGTAWQQVDNTDTVVSVNGQVGVVVLTTTDIAEGTNLYYTDTRARASLTLTTTGSSGASTYNNLTGAFNIPNYTLSGLGGVPSSRQLSINGTAYDLSADRSWSVGTVTSIGTSGPLTGGTITGSGTIGITQSGAASDGYLSSTDWNTFNNKQNALVNPVTGTGTVYYIPMWSAVTALTDSIISYSSNVVNYNYNSASGATVNYINTNGTAYTYTIQMNNTGTRQTYHSYTDGNIIQRINSNDVSRNLQSGQFVLPYYTATSSFTGTSVGYLGFDASGNILTLAIPSLSGYVTGSGVAGQVTFWDSTTNITGSNNLFWDAANARLGIGTNSPTRKLHVVGTSVLFQNAGTFELDLLNTTSGNYLRAVAGATDSNIGTIQNIPFSVIMNGTRVGQFTSTNGNLILQNGGTFTDAGYRLDVQGTARVSGAATFSNLAGTGTRLVVADTNGLLSTQSIGSGVVTGTGTTNYLAKWTSGSAIGNSLIYDDGTNVGIGTTTPFTKLEIIGKLQVGEGGTTGIAGASVVNLYKLANPRISFYDDVDHEASIGVVTVGGFTYGSLTFNVGSGTPERMRITSGGNLLVNSTTDNGNRLQVTGNGYFSANVGIGTAGPYFAKLQVNASGAGFQDALILENTNSAAANLGTALTFAGVGSAAQTVIRSAWDGAATTDAYMSFLTKGSGSVTERMRLTSSGNLGLGVTPSAWWSTVKVLELPNGVSFFSNTSVPASSITTNAFFNTSTTWIYKTSAQATRYDQYQGQHQWYNAPSGTAGNAITFTQAMTLTSGGNLLVGTTADQGYRVQITGSGDNMLNVWGATAPSIRLDNAASGATQRFVIGLATATNNFIQGASAGDVCITTATASPMVFGMWQTSTASEAMRITTSNNLLINKTADGGQKLQVSGKVNFASLPTSATGLSAGDIWNNGGVLNIV